MVYQYIKTKYTHYTCYSARRLVSSFTFLVLFIRNYRRYMSYIKPWCYACSNHNLVLQDASTVLARAWRVTMVVRWLACLALLLLTPGASSDRSEFVKGKSESTSRHVSAVLLSISLLCLFSSWSSFGIYDVLL